MPLPILRQVSSGLRESDPTAPPLVDPIEHLADRGTIGETRELGGEVLLEGFAFAFRTVLQLEVDVVGQTADEDIGHAFILLAERWLRKQVAQMVAPPSITMFWPVRNAPAAEASITAAPAISSASPIRRRGAPDVAFFRISGLSHR